MIAVTNINGDIILADNFSLFVDAGKGLKIRFKRWIWVS